MQSIILELKKVTSEPQQLMVHMQCRNALVLPMDLPILYMGLHTESSILYMGLHTGLSALLHHGNNQENLY